MQKKNANGNYLVKTLRHSNGKAERRNGYQVQRLLISKRFLLGVKVISIQNKSCKLTLFAMVNVSLQNTYENKLPLRFKIDKTQIIKSK
jgi:hypothetical protein